MRREFKSTMCLLVLSMLGALSYAESAHAQIQGINIPESGGRFFIGNFWFWSFALFEPGDGDECSVWLLGEGGLSDDLLVRGTDGPDIMEVFDVPGQTSNEICGVELWPVNRNGHAVIFFGEGGNDQLTDADYMLGGPGRDILDTEGHSLAATGLAWLDGGDNDDHLFSSVKNGAVLVGGGGADHLCMLDDSVAQLIDGGGGSNVFHGSAQKVANATSVSFAQCLAGQP